MSNINMLRLLTITTRASGFTAYARIGLSRYGLGHPFTPPTSQLLTVSHRLASTKMNHMNDSGSTAHNPPDPDQKLSNSEQHKEKYSYRHPTFDVAGRIYIVTGGARGLGLTMAETLAENGAHVHSLDILPTPPSSFTQSQTRLSQLPSSGTLTYHTTDVRSPTLSETISQIATQHSRLDGLVAAAGIQHATPALSFPLSEIDNLLAVNYKGVYLAAVACAREMIKYKTPGAMVLVGSTSGLNAIKDISASVYCSSKAAVIQLARSLAMEWGVMDELGGKGIRVNALCPGNIMTPMVRADLANDPTLRAKWEAANMMNRISEPEEFKGATLFLLSEASSFMTGASLVVDGGYTAW